jgi:hypothetical protein
MLNVPVTEDQKTPHCFFKYKKTMEVFLMYESNLYEVIKAVEACHEHYKAYKKRPNPWRSENTQWDYIIRVCTECGVMLNRYDSLKVHAFCYSCREVLFPETVTPSKAFDKDFIIYDQGGIHDKDHL